MTIDEVRAVDYVLAWSRQEMDHAFDNNARFQALITRQAFTTRSLAVYDLPSGDCLEYLHMRLEHHARQTYLTITSGLNYAQCWIKTGTRP